MDSLKRIGEFFLSPKVSHVFKSLIGLFVFIIFFTMIGVNFIEWQYVFMIDAVLLVVFILLHRLRWGLYLMLLLFPFMNFEFRLGAIHVPYVDLAAMATFLAFALKTVGEIMGRETTSWVAIKRIFPGFGFALLFFLASFLSVYNNEFWQPAIKYLLRPIVFFYLMFLVLPYNVIDKKKVFERSLKLFVLVGVIVAIMGLLSFASAGGPWYSHRAVPFSFGDFNPLGGNHNAIAEILVVTIPAALILFWREDKIKRRGWWLMAVSFMAIILLLTFSRAGWLALLVEALVLFFVENRRKLDKYAVTAVILILIFAASLFYLSVWQQVSWIQSSNSNRLMLTSIAFSSFLNHPIIGNGLNTFQDLIGRTFVYKVEFGDPLESHGFIQKISTESGLLGIISFLLLLGYLFFNYIKGYGRAQGEKEKQLVACLIVMLVGIVFFELFSTSYYVARMWLPIGVGLAGIKLIKRQ